MPVRAQPFPCVLTIAGSDSGAGAGVQADARTIHALGGFACMAITALTAQNTRGVRRWRAAPLLEVTAQIHAVLPPRAASNSGSANPSALGTLPVGAIKTGLLPGANAVRAVARALKDSAPCPLVIDPVIGSTSGTRFLDASGLRALRRELGPLATLLTPNWPEAAALSGRPVKDYDGAEAAARSLAEQLGVAVLLKGGHAPGAICRDCLATPDGRLRWYESARVATANTHGTGCVLSAAIATELARGVGLAQAVARGRAFLQRSLRRHRRDRWGGAGPAFPGLR